MFSVVSVSEINWYIYFLKFEEIKMSEKILLVEDDDKIRGIVSEYFTAKSEGRFEVIEASTGEE